MTEEKLSIIAKALSDKTRVCIIKKIAEKEICACKLLESLECCQSTLSHHMKVLTTSGLIISKEVGKWTHYSFNNILFDEYLSALRKFKK